jgi:hypothetical protein
LEKNNKEIRFFFTSDKNCDEERIKTTRSHEVMLTITKLRIAKKVPPSEGNLAI